MTSTTQAMHVPLAVVGAGSLFPGSVDVRGFWRSILEGRDQLRDVPYHYWRIEDYYDANPKAPDKTYCKRGGFVDPVDFDPVKFGIPPRLLPYIDSCQLLALVVAQQTLDGTRCFRDATVANDRVAVILGVAGATEMVGEMACRIQRPVWRMVLEENNIPEDRIDAICDRIASQYAEWSESTFPGLLGNVIAGRIANHFNFAGTNFTTDAACASSFSALAAAANELYLGHADLVLTGGVDTTNDPMIYMCFSKTPALSPTGDCRPFDKDADGTVLGEGFGMVALRRLDDAERDGDCIYAVLRGIGASSDGRAKSIYAPRPEGQAIALQRAYDMAGYLPSTVELVEAHGTGTPAGDAAEVAGLLSVFSGGAEGNAQRCALGSIKSQIGHTKGAAAAAGLIKTVLALHHKTLPPTIKVNAPAPQFSKNDNPFYVNTESRPWIRASGHPRRASVSSFGFGGTNFHVSLEEFTGQRIRAPRLRTAPAELVLFSAASREELAELCERTAELGVPESGLAHFARQKQLDFDPGSAVRLAIVATDSQDLRSKASHALSNVKAQDSDTFKLPSGVYFSSIPQSGEVAVLFPGQGSQYVGMGADLLMAFDATRELWDREATRISDPLAALHRVVYPVPVFTPEDRESQKRRLTATEWAQPAIGAASASTWNLLRAMGIRPTCFAGHSFGELTALYAAGALDEEHFLDAARKRGELMAEAAAASGPSGMTSVFAPLATVRALLERSGCGACIANHNSPKQVILSGSVSELDAAERVFNEAGFSTRRLLVAAAFHTARMIAYADRFIEYLRSIPMRAPDGTVFSNLKAEAFPAEMEELRQILVAGMTEPVRFVDEVEAMYAFGARTFLEVGPGSVLTGLVSEILAGRAHTAISTDRKGANGVVSLWHALGQLAVAGHRLDFAPIWSEYDLGPDPASREKPAMTVRIDGVNYQKPYPPPPDQYPSRPAAMPRESSAVRASAKTDNTHQERKGSTPLNTHDRATDSPNSDGMGEWIAAYQEIQRQTAELHAAYQRSMADTHLAFLHAASASAQHLAELATGNGHHASPEPRARIVSQALTAQPSEDLHVASQNSNGLERTTAQPFDSPVLQPAGTSGGQAPDGTSSGDVRVSAKPGQSRSPLGAGDTDLQTFLLTIVAEKTGYPIDVLNLDMGLEDDLGIDSIKRVEILSDFEEKFPDLPALDLGALAGLRTLGEILDYMKQQSGAQADQLSIPEGIGRDTAAHAGFALPHSPGGNGSGSSAIVGASGRFVVRLREKDAEGTSIPGLADVGTLAIVDDEGGVGDALDVGLKRRGIASILVSSVDSIPRDTRAVLFLRALRTLDLDASVELNREAFCAAKRLNQDTDGAPVVFVTVQDTGGDFGMNGQSPIHAGVSGLSGLVKTVAQEWSHGAGKAIDIERGDRSSEAIANCIVQELTTGGNDVEVSLRADGSRAVVRTEPASLSRDDVGETTLPRGAAIVVSGGGRGITTDTLKKLVPTINPRLLILGRTPLFEEPAEFRLAEDEAAIIQVLMNAAKSNGGDTVSPSTIASQAKEMAANRSIQQNLRELRELGAEVRYAAVDVRDEQAVARALDEARAEWGPFSALIHGAGVLADKRIVDKTLDQFDRVFDTKVRGFQSLLAATREDPLRAIVVFSSIVARTGNAGQADYAMANEVLNKLAACEAHRRGPSCLVKSLNWGPWKGGMMTPALQRLFLSRGMTLIEPSDGADMLLNELSGPNHSVEIILLAPLSTDAARHTLAGALQPVARVRV